MNVHSFDQGGEDIYDVHTDHLDTPRMLTDENENVVWRAAYECALSKPVRGLRPASCVVGVR